MLREVLAAEILEHAGLDPRIVALEIKESLNEIDVDGAEPVVEDDPVGHVGDQVVEARLVQAPLAELVQTVAGRLGQRFEAASAPRSPGETRRRASQRVNLRLLSTYRPYSPVNAVN